MIKFNFDFFLWISLTCYWSLRVFFCLSEGLSLGLISIENILCNRRQGRYGIWNEWKYHHALAFYWLPKHSAVRWLPFVISILHSISTYVCTAVALQRTDDIHLILSVSSPPQSPADDSSHHRRRPSGSWKMFNLGLSSFDRVLFGSCTLSLSLSLSRCLTGADGFLCCLRSESRKKLAMWIN